MRLDRKRKQSGDCSAELWAGPEHKILAGFGRYDSIVQPWKNSVKDRDEARGYLPQASGEPDSWYPGSAGQRNILHPAPLRPGEG